MKTLREQDMRAEHALAEFMDSGFYSKLHDKNGNKIDFERVTDLKRQRDGLDVILSVADKKYYIDEKASLYYSNMMIPTFAFEVNSIQGISIEPIKGWLIDDKLKTEYYMLIWPNVKCKNNGNVWERISLKDLDKKDFTIVEAFLIQKKRILKYLEGNKWDEERILSYATKIRDYGKKDLQNMKIKVEESEDFYFYYTKNLAEKPINIVIKKDILRQLSDACYFISNDCYARIK